MHCVNIATDLQYYLAFCIYRFVNICCIYKYVLHLLFLPLGITEQSVITDDSITRTVRKPMIISTSQTPRVLFIISSGIDRDQNRDNICFTFIQAIIDSLEGQKYSLTREMQLLT